MRVDEEPVVVEETLNAPVETVWNAISRADLMRQWFFDNIPDFKPEVGFGTQFNVKSGDRNFLHQWKVTEVVPNRKLKYSWTYDEYAGDAFVTFELSEQGNGTKLRLSVEVIEDFQQDIPEFTRANCVAGWEYFISQRLKDYLEPSQL
jgi:uncharacterized protein YndB with AHSA1/START domain